MDWLCNIINHSKIVNDSISEKTVYDVNVTDFVHGNFNEKEAFTISDTPRPEDGFTFVVTKLITPSLCVFGLVGNFLNLVILIKRVREGVDQMEKGAIIGMIGLALSDFFFCFVTICDTFTLQNQMIFYGKSVMYFLTISREFLQNTLIKTSTCFTVIMAVGRHVAVCYPMKARQYMRPCHTSVAMLFSFTVWLLLHIPLLWTWEVHNIYCPNPQKNIIYLDVGIFVADRKLRITFTYIWALMGFFVPVVVLAYCNYRLIQSLRLSRKLRTNNSKRTSSMKSSYDSQRRISITLVAIVVMFFITVCPSEILHFVADAVSDGEFQHTNLLLITNLLQVVNFSGNFALYCAVNSYFRKVLRSLPPCEWDKERGRLILRKNRWNLHRGGGKRNSVSLMTRSSVTRDSFVSPKSVLTVTVEGKGINDSRL